MYCMEALQLQVNSFTTTFHVTGGKRGELGGGGGDGVQVEQ